MHENEDLYHLRLLSVFHYVVAGVIALIFCFPFIHFTVGLGMIVAGLVSWRETGPLALMGVMFVTIASGLILLGWSLAACTALAGRFLGQRRHYTYCLVLGVIVSTFAPFGTVLGIFTILVLMRPSVKALFEPAGSAAAAQVIT